MIVHNILIVVQTTAWGEKRIDVLIHFSNGLIKFKVYPIHIVASYLLDYRQTRYELGF